MPADHNLTILEAILLYGPDFNRVIISRNFKAQNLDWFYTVFSPIQDFYFTWGKQCMIGLGWGDKEQFLAMPYSRGRWFTGFLPWATESLSERQLRLMKSALREKRRANLLACHFTLVNYDAPIPIAEEGEVNFNDTVSSITNHSEGTFTNNRKPLYRLLLDGAFSCTLSGHSHRAAHYRISEKDDGPIRHDFKVRGCAPCARSGKYDLKNHGPHIVVSASGGPIPVQNHQGELAGQGLDLPSGTQIGFSPEGEITEIRVRRTRNPKAKPRLSVALDYADLLGPEDDGPGTVFSRFEQTTWEGPFQLEVNPNMGLPAIEWISDFQVFKFDRGAVKQMTSEFTFENGRQYQLKLNDISEIAERDASYFVQVMIDNEICRHKNFEHYDPSTPWVWQIEFVSRQQEAIDRFRKSVDLSPEPIPEWVIVEREEQIRRNVNGYRVQRHSKFGEIPNLRKYSVDFGADSTR